MPSFEEILNQKSSEIQPPKAYPVGTYHCMVDGRPSPVKIGAKQTDALQFKLKVLAVMDDVDAREAAEQGMIGKTITENYYITEAAKYRLKEFLTEHLGIEHKEGTPEEKKLIEMVDEAPGKQVLVKIKHDISKDAKRVFTAVESTAHV